MLKKNNNNILKNIYFLEFLDLNSKNTKNAHLFINKNKLDLKNELMYNFTDFDFTYYFSQKTQKFLIKFYSQSQPEVNNNHLNEINMHTEIFNYRPVLVVNNYFIDNFIFVTYLTQLNSNR
jgi:hypothetical protein